MITVICRLKDGYSIADAAQEVKDTLGKGGNPDAQVIEDFVGYTNCPTLGPYFRASFDPAYAAALEYLKEIDGSETCEVVDVEWEGQKMFYHEINPEIGPEPLGMISNCTIFSEEIINENA